MIEIVVATSNKGKLKEISAALKDLDAIFIPLSEFPDPPQIVEDGETFLDNARKKAHTIAAHTGMFSLADDSGLEVDALDGAPGVRSARFAGEDASDRDNNLKLLNEMRDVDDAERTARFKAVIVVASPAGEEIVAEGSVEGVILHEPRGEGGFGYDPLFYYPPFKKTFSETTIDEKLSVSHRGRALESLKEKLSVCRICKLKY